MGIASWSSGFIVTGDGIDPTTANTFRNLDYGIRTFAYFGTNKPINIEYNLFEYNKTACYLSAEIYAAVNRNKFVIKSGQTLITSDGYSGLYLDACTGYQVEENEFYSNYHPTYTSTYSRSYGLVVNNSGPEDNMIYNNNFHNLGYATIAQNQNRDKARQTGLQYKCNVFQDNYKDIAVTWDGDPSVNNGIAENQGSKTTEVTAPAGNLFSQIGKSDFSDFDNQGEYVWYHLPNASNGLYFPIIPKYFTSNTIKREFNNDINTWNPTNGCPSLLNGRTKSEIVTSISSNEVNRIVYADSLDIKTDDGNTTSLNLDVVTSIPPETMQLRNQLLDASPYLSDTVMVNAAAKEEVLSNSIITEILSSNPHSAKANNVLNTLYARNNPPNENELGTIHSNDTIMGAKEILESKVSFYNAQKQQNVNDLVRWFMQDTTITAVYDSIESSVANISTPISYYLQTFARFNKGDSIGVLNKLSDVTTNFNLNTYETDVHIGFEDYFEVMLTLQSENKNVKELDSVQKTVLCSVMHNSHDLVKAFSRNILIKTDSLEYHEPYILPDTSSTKSSKVVNSKINIENNISYLLRLYPIPAHDYLTVEYQIPPSGNGIVEVLTLKGVEMEAYSVFGMWGEKIIDLRNYQPGVYFIRLWNNAKLLQTKKFIKQ